MEDTDEKPNRADRELTCKGRVLRIRLKTVDEATAVYAALNNPEVIETLDAVGRHSLLSPKQKQLAAVLAADEAAA